jgi:hypothetical protein
VQKQKTFVVQLDQMTNAPNDEQQLTTALDAMRRQVKADGGLPTGITKEMIVKTCRRRKALKYWPTNVEIAYVNKSGCVFSFVVGSFGIFSHVYLLLYTS